MSHTKTKTKTLQVPIRVADGSLEHYPLPQTEATRANIEQRGDQSWFVQTAWVWKDAWFFDDELTYIHTERGRSAVTPYFKSLTTGAIYPMFYSEFERLVRWGCRPGPTFSGTWGFRKHGQNYSICLATPNVGGEMSREARALALAVLAGERVAAAALADKVTEEFQ